MQSLNIKNIPLLEDSDHGELLNPGKRNLLWLIPGRYATSHIKQREERLWYANSAQRIIHYQSLNMSQRL